MTSNPAELHQGEMIACHECDFLHTVQPVPAGGKALCARCGALLYRHIPNSLDRALALNLAALMLFVMANAFPLMSLKLSGRSEENVLLSGAMALYRLGMGEVGVLVFLTSFFFPLVGIVGLLYVLFPLKFGYRAWGMAPVYRLVQAVTPWSLIGVFMLGVLVAIVKLLDMATIIPGISLYSFAALLVVVTAARANLDPAVIWWRMGCKPTVNGAGTTAVERDSVNCHTCSLLVSKASLGGYGHGTCPRCGSFLHSRKVNSVARTWALIFAAALLFIPANIYPVMTVIRFGQGEPNTIFSGVVHLIEGGMWPLAMLIFFASIVIPVTKLIVLAFLLVTIRTGSPWRPRDRTVLFRITEAIGAWSMVDVFLVAILVALVNLDSLATVRPGIGVTFFAAVVVITMIAAHSFDPRLIWDNRRPE